MISIAACRGTDFRTLEERISEVRTLEELQGLYNALIEEFLRLNELYMFSESFDRAFVCAQLEEQWGRPDGELYCIPYGIKDVFNTKVLPTGMGSDQWSGFKAGNNARIVDELAERGGIVFAKTTTAEFAVHYIQAGRTLNPHDATRITGTSSAGSAVAVACGALPVCLGTQTGGSIVRPASFCGVYGFKPSFGAFDRTGTLKTTDTLDTIGLLGSDLYGLRKTFLSTFQKEPQYPLARRYFDALTRHRGRQTLCVAILDEQFDGFAGYDAGVQSDFRAATKVLEAGDIRLSRIAAVEFINEVHQLHQQIYTKSLSYYFQQEARSGGEISAVMRAMIDAGSRISAETYVEALRRQPVLRSQFDAAFSDYDFLITPSTASVAPRVGELERDDTSLIWTFFGYPVVSIPAFMSDELGLPFGLQLVGPRYADLALLDFAAHVTTLLRNASASRW